MVSESSREEREGINYTIYSVAPGQDNMINFHGRHVPPPPKSAPPPLPTPTTAATSPHHRPAGSGGKHGSRQVSIEPRDTHNCMHVIMTHSVI